MILDLPEVDAISMPCPACGRTIGHGRIGWRPLKSDYLGRMIITSFVSLNPCECPHCGQIFVGASIGGHRLFLTGMQSNHSDNPLYQGAIEYSYDFDLSTTRIEERYGVPVLVPHTVRLTINDRY